MAPVLTDVAEAAEAAELLRHCAFTKWDDDEKEECEGEDEDEDSPLAEASVADGYAPRFVRERFDRHVDEFLRLNLVTNSLQSWSFQTSYFVSLFFSVSAAAAIVLQARSPRPHTLLEPETQPREGEGEGEGKETIPPVSETWTAAGGSPLARGERARAQLRLRAAVFPDVLFPQCSASHRRAHGARTAARAARPPA